MTNPYIIRQDRGSYYGGIEYLLADDLRVQYEWNYREKDRRHVEGLGTIREIEHTTRRKSHVRVFLPEAVTSSGTKLSTSWNTVSVKLLDLKKHLRRLLDTDAEGVEALDAAITEHIDAVKALRLQRAELVQKAWRRAEPVQSIEVVDAAEAHLAEHP